jgi:hypothetical protein
MQLLKHLLKSLKPIPSEQERFVEDEVQSNQVPLVGPLKEGSLTARMTETQKMRFYQAVDLAG